MTSWIWKQDRFVPGDALPLTDRAVRHGLSLFETLAVRDGRTRFVEEHLSLLSASAAAQAWPIPGEFRTSAAAILHHPGMDCGSARLYLTAGPGAAGDPVGPCGGFLLLDPAALAPDPEPPKLTWEMQPFVAATPGLKTGNYWFHHAARHRAQQSGFNDALIVNRLDELVCASMANVFVVLDGKLLTPPLSSGARPGIVRDWVLQHAGAVERVIRRDDVVRASELFLTNSLVGIRPAGSIGDQIIPGRLIASEISGMYEASFAR